MVAVPLLHAGIFEGIEFVIDNCSYSWYTIVNQKSSEHPQSIACVRCYVNFLGLIPVFIWSICELVPQRREAGFGSKQRM